MLTLQQAQEILAKDSERRAKNAAYHKKYNSEHRAEVAAYHKKYNEQKKLLVSEAKALLASVQS